MSSKSHALAVLLLVTASQAVSQIGVAMELLYDFETDDQHREENLDMNSPPGWGSFGTITLDRGPNSDASAGETARFHAGDFDLPADLPGNFGLINVSDRFTPYRKDFSGFTGLALDMKFVSNDDLPYVGHTDVEVGLGFMVPGVGEDVSLQAYAPPITLTDTYDTYEISFDDLEFVQSGSTLENDLANNAFIKIRFLNTLENEGRGRLYYDEVYGLTTETAGLAGDYNDDGFVNAADYTVWRDANGTTATLPNEVETPGEVTAEDYDTWKANYGSSASLSTAIPEPTGLSLAAMVGINALAMVRTRRRSR